MPTDGPAGVLLRAATDVELPLLGELNYAARLAAGAAMPPPVHSLAETRDWARHWDRAADDVWVAEKDGAVLGYARFTATWLDDLYVGPEHQGSGVGGALFALVAAQRPDGFCLWAFESNQPARRFYRKRGCVELERTDGSANEERAADVRLAWPGAEPLTFLRRLIDDTDRALGDVLAQRTALTRAVQQVKVQSGVRLDRDPQREAEVVRRVAAVAPELGEERVARIVEIIISESLDAADVPRTG